MKKRRLLFIIGLIVIGGFSLFLFNGQSAQQRYTPRTADELGQNTSIKGAMEWLKQLRANPETGEIDQAAISRSQKQLTEFRKQKNTSELQLDWIEMGPDNVGGRTRALLIDKDDPNTMFAGGVAGGLWISTTGGSYWKPYNDLMENLSVTSICQAANGDIYFGTGEGAFTGTNGTTNSTNGMRGQGIWKSSDGGNSFTRLESTWLADSVENDTGNVKGAFRSVAKMAADPQNPDRIYAATGLGLRVSDNGGTTWYNPIFLSETSEINIQDVATDVKVSEDGWVIASVGNRAYLSETGNTRSFTKVSGSISNGLLPQSDVTRLEFAYSKSNPAMLYCMIANSDDGLNGIYRSDDHGQSWILVKIGSNEFNPLGSQGTYDAVIAVFPDDEYKVMIGGQYSIWIGTGSAGTTDYYWEAKSMWYLSPGNYYYVHADHHAIVFHPEYDGVNNKTVYVGSDGGVAMSLYGGDYWQDMNKGYNVTQFYAIGMSGNGKVVGGTQDNGTQHIEPFYSSFLGKENQSSVEILGGDGGDAAISKLNPNASFGTIYYGQLYRTPTETEDLQDFYSSFLKSKVNVDDGTVKSGSFVTPFALWESEFDIYSQDYVTYSNDTIYFTSIADFKEFENEYKVSHPTAKIDTTFFMDNQGLVTITTAITYYTGDYVVATSMTAGLDLKQTLTKTLYPGESIKVKDTYQSLLAVGLNARNNTIQSGGRIWITRQPLNFAVEPSPVWVQLLPKEDVYGQIEEIEISKDGNHLFFTTNTRQLVRVSGLLYFRDVYNEQGNLFDGDSTDIITVDLLKTFGSQIAGIGIDPNNPDNVIVCCGGYGNEGTVHVYYSTNATGAGDFVSKQGNLPSMPTYDGILNWKDGKQAIVGTEYGVFGTDDITAEDVIWTELNSAGMANVPVFSIKQQIIENNGTSIENHGFIYIGTHGRGIYRAENFAGPLHVINPEPVITSNDISELIVYPNPANGFTNVSISLAKASDINIKIYDLNGRIAFEENKYNQEAGENTYRIDLTKLSHGTYVVRVTEKENTSSAKLIIR